MSKMSEMDIYINELIMLEISEPELNRDDALDLIVDEYGLTPGEKRTIIHLLAKMEG